MSTNQPGFFLDSRVVLLSPTLIGIDLASLGSGGADLMNPLSVTVLLNASAAIVPLPPAVYLFVCGFAGLIGLARRKAG